MHKYTLFRQYVYSSRYAYFYWIDFNYKPTQIFNVYQFNTV